MAIIDSKLFLSNTPQALTASAASEDVIDLGEAQDLGIGGGNQVRLVVEAGEDFDSSGDAATLTISVVDDTALPIDGSSTVIVQSEAIPEASLTKGYRKELVIPEEPHGRYLGVYYTVGTENFTAGTVYAWLEAL
jgi:hypothetical protein